MGIDIDFSGGGGNNGASWAAGAITESPVGPKGPQGSLNPWPIQAWNATYNSATSIFDQMRSMMGQYDEGLKSLISTLAALPGLETGEPPKAIDITAGELPPLDLSHAPFGGLYRPVFPLAPGKPDISALLYGLTAGLDDLLKDLPEAPKKPATNMPASPTLSAIPPPQRPSGDMSVHIPAPPTLLEPQLPTLVDINIPDFQPPEIPDFNATPPDGADLTPPSVHLNWEEPVYKSELLPELVAKVREWLKGGTGLPPAVEDALFSRARERVSAETSRAVGEAVTLWASRGFTMPPGMLVAAADAAREDGSLRAAELSRDILIEAAKWEIENIRFAMERGIALEGLLEALFSNMAQRAFEAARFTAQAQIEMFNARVALLNARWQGFSVLATVYKTRIEGLLARITAYRTMVEAEIAKGQINEQHVAIYKARVEAMLASVEVYKALMGGAEIEANVIKNRFDAYRADVEAFSAQLAAEKTKFDVYRTQVEAESTKAGLFEVETRGFAAILEAMKARADVLIKGREFNIEAARALIEEHRAALETHRAQMEAELRQMEASVRTQAAEVDVWKTGVDAQGMSLDARLKVEEYGNRMKIANAELDHKRYALALEKAIRESELLREALKTIGAYLAQMAAGAMSALHAS
ncbi:MAG: hypothetical protein LBO79_06255, partial [Zoogloeaceae bacterium]|nr:hypothetical protein [Zoogloeaceae bacterium]